MGLLGAIALVIAAESFVASHEAERFTTNTAASWRQTGRAAGKASRCDVLCFGDSMVKFGLSPAVIEARTGWSAYNLAPYGGPPSASYLLLRRALAAGAKPRAVVVDFMPHLLAVTPRFHVRAWQEMVTPVEAADLAWSSRDAALFAELVVGRLLASARDRHEIRQSLRCALDGGSYSAALAHFVTPLWRNWRLNRGGQVLAKNGYDGQARPTDRALFPTDWKEDPDSAAYMHRFLALARSQRIPVYWLLPPLSPSTQQLRERLGRDAAYTSLVRSVQARYPNVIVVDARRSGFGREVFTDPVHLDRQGTIALSAALAGLLRRQDRPDGDTSRWVALPRYREPSGDLALEDTDQSRLAVKARAEGRLR
jgi:hypothetical protein